MKQEEVVAYIRKGIEIGQTDEKTHAKLRSIGLADAEINASFEQARAQIASGLPPLNPRQSDTPQNGKKHDTKKTILIVALAIILIIAYFAISYATNVGSTIKQATNAIQVGAEAAKQSNPDLCNQMNGDDALSACCYTIGRAKADPTLCEKASRLVCKEGCVIGVAEERLDTELCSTITTPSLQTQCYKSVNRKKN